MWPSSGSYMRLGRSTHTERCFSRKSSGMCGQGIRWNQVNFMGVLPLAALYRGKTIGGKMPEGRRRLFDSHCHIIDHRFPIVANQGYVPPAFPLEAYLAEAKPLG